MPTTSSRAIQIVTRKGIPKNSIAAIARELRNIGDVHIREESPEPHGAGEWALPALVIILVAKPLFEGFLNELGAEGARTLKGKLANFIRRLKTRVNRWRNRYEIESYSKQIEAGQAPPLPGRLGPIFSIEFELEHTTRITYSIRYVFPHGMSDDEIATALKQLSHDIRAAAERERAAFPATGYLIGNGTYVYFSDTQQWQKV